MSFESKLDIGVQLFLDRIDNSGEIDPLWTECLINPPDKRYFLYLNGRSPEKTYFCATLKSLESHEVNNISNFSVAYDGRIYTLYCVINSPQLCRITKKVLIAYKKKLLLR